MIKLNIIVKVITILIIMKKGLIDIRDKINDKEVINIEVKQKLNDICCVLNPIFFNK